MTNRVWIEPRLFEVWVGYFGTREATVIARCTLDEERVRTGREKVGNGRGSDPGTLFDVGGGEMQWFSDFTLLVNRWKKVR